MARALTNAEIATLASKPGVKRIAVENFLGSMPVSLSRHGNLGNMRLDARSYRWNVATQDAIEAGINLAYGQAS